MVGMKMHELTVALGAPGPGPHKSRHKSLSIPCFQHPLSLLPAPSGSGPRSFAPPASVIDIQLNPTEGQKRRGEENAAKIINQV